MIGPALSCSTPREPKEVPVNACPKTPSPRLAAFAAALLLSNGVAHATPLPNPPFAGGFVPANAAVLKAEQLIMKTIAKAFTSGQSCFTKGATNVFKGRPGTAGDGDAQACLSDPQKGVAARAQSLIIGLYATFPPSVQNCLLANVGVLTGLQSQTSGLLPRAFCAGSTDLPAAFGAGAKLPDDKATLQAEVKAISIFGKACAAVQKCIDKGVQALAKGEGGDGGVTSCAQAAQAKGEAEFEKLRAKSGGSPACIFDGTTKDEAISAFRNLMFTVTAAVYCAEN
ncbi:MAG: hypothetical protein ACKPBU_13420 [Alphaproteobacteria bacterium]